VARQRGSFDFLLLFDAFCQIGRIAQSGCSAVGAAAVLRAGSAVSRIL
jgi:hypothetical protein